MKPRVTHISTAPVTSVTHDGIWAVEMTRHGQLMDNAWSVIHNLTTALG